MQLNDAYEEVDEQRQSVASWKRKAQKAQGEANDIREGNALTLLPNTLSLSKRHKSNLAGNGDSVSKPPRALRLLLEEQTSRNTLLEKKQRKFDAEVGSLNEELRRESDAREKVARELDEAKRNKFLLEDEVQVGGDDARAHRSRRPDAGGKKFAHESRKRHAHLRLPSLFPPFWKALTGNILEPHSGVGPLFFKCGTNSGRMFLTGLPTNLNHAARQVPPLPEHQADAKRNGVGLINPFTSHAPPARALPPRRRRSPSSIPPSLSDAYLDILRAVVGWLLQDCCGVSNIANYFISAVPVTSSATLLQFFSNLLRPTSQRAWFDKPF